MKKPRKDLMKPKEIDHSQAPEVEGGMAHSLKKQGNAWGEGKLPPFPRSDLRTRTRSGMAFVKQQPSPAQEKLNKEVREQFAQMK